MVGCSKHRYRFKRVRVNMPPYELYDLVNKFEKVYYKDIYDETRGSIGVPQAVD